MLNRVGHFRTLYAHVHVLALCPDSQKNGGGEHFYREPGHETSTCMFSQTTPIWGLIVISLQGVVGCCAADGAGQRSGSSGEVPTAAGRCHPQQYHNP